MYVGPSDDKLIRPSKVKLLTMKWKGTRYWHFSYDTEWEVDISPICWILRNRTSIMFGCSMNYTGDQKAIIFLIMFRLPQRNTTQLAHSQFSWDVHIPYYKFNFWWHLNLWRWGSIKDLQHKDAWQLYLNTTKSPLETAVLTLGSRLMCNTRDCPRD